MTSHELQQTVSNLRHLHEQLIEIADLKKRLIIENNVEQLQAEVKKEAKILHQITEQESKSRELTKRWFDANASGTAVEDKQDWAVSDLLERISDENEKQSLQNAVLLLKESIAKLQEKNELNKMLIAHSLDYIQVSLDLILTPDDSQFIYSNHPEQPEPNRSSIRRNFDAKA